MGSVMNWSRFIDPDPAFPPAPTGDTWNVSNPVRVTWQP